MTDIVGLPQLPKLNNSRISEPAKVSNRLEEKSQASDPYISEKIIDKGASFFATFIDGSSFRNMIEYIRLINIKGIFRFTRHNIFYQQGDKDKGILNMVELKTYELTDYDFNSDKEEIIFGVDLSRLRDITRNIGKKDHLDIYKLPKEPNNLYLRIRSQSEKGSDSLLCPVPITTSGNEINLYTEPPYSINKREPTCTVYQSDFSKLCKSLSTIKCRKAIIHGFKKGAVIKGILSTGAIGSVKEFGKCCIGEDSSVSADLKSLFNHSRGKIVKSDRPAPILNIKNAGLVEEFHIDISIVKHLVKLNALSPTGTIKMYVEKGLPLKLTCNIGTFGKLYIYLS